MADKKPPNPKRATFNKFYKSEVISPYLQKTNISKSSVNLSEINHSARDSKVTSEVVQNRKASAEIRKGSLKFQEKAVNGFQINWKTNSSTPYLKDQSYEVDLPIFSELKGGLKSGNLKQLKFDLSSLKQKVMNEVNNNPSVYVFYRFLTSYCFKLIMFLKSCDIDIKRFLVDLQFIAPQESMDNFAKLLKLWGGLQDAYMDLMINKDEYTQKIAHQFAEIEEENNLFKDFVEQRSKYSPNRLIEIQVNQIVKKVEPKVKVLEIQKTERKEELKETPRSSVIQPTEVRTSVASKKQVFDKITQTEEMEKEEVNIDYMDKATGPDREIPVYRPLAIQVDLRHPIEDAHDQLKSDYQQLKEENRMLKEEAENMIRELREEYGLKISNAARDANGEIVRLQKIVDYLQSENDRLERELNDSNSNVALKEIELAAVREKMAQVGQQLAILTEADKDRKRVEAELNDTINSQKVELLTKEKKEGELSRKLDAFEKRNLELSELSHNQAAQLQQTCSQLNDTKVYNEVLIGKNKRLEEELSSEKEAKQALEEEYDKLLDEEKEARTRARLLQEANDELEQKIAVLMQFPDLSLGNDFNLNAITDGHKDYTKYRPIASSTLVFNISAIERSRPTTADSSKTQIQETTYIIGSSNKSRPVSASNVRILCPGSAISDKSFKYGSLKDGQIDIKEIDPTTTFPPPLTKFPFLNNRLDPLSAFDGVVLEDFEESVPKPVPRRPISASTRPPSGALYRWNRNE
ncbi:hypothetical protein HDV06_001937 [Boothiomyces sp. JEL0866]|nr:hypothetical protein HDV06_001937 [Boothiomyces sp. JEL0866]